MCNLRKRQGPPETSGSLDRSSGQYWRVSGVFCTVSLLAILATCLIGTFDSRLERKLRESRLTISTFESVTADASKRQPFRLNALAQLMGLRQPYVTIVPGLFHPTTHCMVSSEIVKAKIFHKRSKEFLKRSRRPVGSLAVSASRYAGGKVVYRRGVSAQ